MFSRIKKEGNYVFGPGIKSTYACMIKRNLSNLDFSAVTGSPDKEQKWVRHECFNFIDKRFVALYSEPK